MTPSDLPIVDENSKSSEESVLAVKSFFSTRNGFISRVETPDYGCDLDVELILDDKNASSKKFPIQIKSSQKFNEIAIEGEIYLSKSFPVKSLKYLCERSPAYGLIILYDDRQKICYYDYVEKVVERLNTERGNDEEWSNKPSVNIHVPKDNVISTSSLQTIYNVFLSRFKAHTVLLQMHGKEYSIPSLSKEETLMDERLSPVQLLQKYGLVVLDEYNIKSLYQLLTASPSKEIISSKELTFIACVVYAEMGMCIEAEFYFKKAQQFKDDFDSQENEILTFSRIKVDYLLGKRTKEDFFNDIKKLSKNSTNINNKLQLQINLFYYAVIEQIDKSEYDESIEKEMLGLFETIDASGIPQNKKWLLKTYQAENLHMYISSWMLQKISRHRIRETLAEYIPIEESNSIWAKTNLLIHYVTSVVLGALQYAMDEKDELIQGHAYYALGRFVLIKEFDFLLLHFKDTDPSLEENFKRAFIQSLEAHNLFIELSMIKDARIALINARDLHRLAKLYYNLDISSEQGQEEIIADRIKNYEAEMGIETPEQSIIDPAYDSYVKSRSFDSRTALQNMSDDDILRHSKIVLDSYRLPEDRLLNIIADFKSYKFFYSNCNADRYELLANLKHLLSQADKYKNPSSFIIRDKTTGIESLPNTDVKHLMENFGLLK